MTALVFITLFDLAFLVSAYTFGTGPQHPIGRSLFLLGTIIVCVLIFTVAYIRKYT